MAYSLRCPCGTTITYYDEGFVAKVQEHLAAEHPGRTYGENEIMMMALPAPDRLVVEGQRS